VRTSSGRRTRVVLSCALLLTGGLLADLPTAAEPVAEAQAGWQPRWAPEAGIDGLAAFEGVEDDRANSHPAGQPHIVVEDNNYRFTMHMVDRDTMTDRQRQEVKGMHAGGQDLILLEGETWRFTQSMFIPGPLKATTTFTHIMQMKTPGNDTLPILVMSLRRYGSIPKIELRDVESNLTVGAVDLAPLQNRWVDVELEMTIGDGTNGALRWVVRNGTSTVIDVSRTGVDTWLGDRVRPKWGIYRSLGDTSGSLQDCYLLITNMRAYQWTGTLPPRTNRYEAEDATLFHGVVESNHTGFTGTGFVNPANEVGSYLQWTVNSPAAGTASLAFRYANGTTTNRPMDVRVNGVLVADELAFNPTPSWDDWATRTMTAAVAAGSNTIRATATTANGGPNVDNLQVQFPAPPPTRYEAESATISQGVVQSDHVGFSGSGFVNYDNVAGSSVRWTVNAPAAGTTTLMLRFANGTTANRPMDVRVNGVLVATGLAFEGTGSWDTWQSRPVTVPLAAGANTVQATATTASGGPNVDYLEVQV